MKHPIFKKRKDYEMNGILRELKQRLRSVSSKCSKSHFPPKYIKLISMGVFFFTHANAES